MSLWEFKSKISGDRKRWLAQIFQGELQIDKEGKDENEVVDDSSNDSEDSLDINYLRTRSGIKYPNLPASTMAPPDPTGTPTPTPVPIRVLPTSFSVREVNAEDANYSAQEFITLCEDVMKGSTVTSDEDRISFVRSRLAPGSRALHRMQTSLFLLKRK